MVKLYLNSCKIRLLQFFYFSLAAGTARRWLTNRYPLRRVGHPNVWRNAGLVCPWATLCGDRACRMGKHVVWGKASPAATVCGDRAFQTPKNVVECEFLLGTGNLYRDRAGRTSKHVAKCKFGEARRSPFARNEGQPSKTGVILWMKVEMQAWHESQMAITVGKLWFFNARCKRSRIGVNLRVYPFWNVRHNCFARNKTCVKLRFYKVRRKPFTQNDCPRSKFAIFQRRMQPFRTIWWPNVKNLS